MAEDSFEQHRVFPTGVWWQPSDYKPIDQTVYLDYANRRFDNFETDPDTARFNGISVVKGIPTGDQRLDDLDDDSEITPDPDMVRFLDEVKAGVWYGTVDENDRGLVVHLKKRDPSQEKHGS
jgi:hypothetical protein